MHVIQYVATTADNAESAHSFVKNYLESLMGNDDSHNTWYDWFVTGGGRWASGEDNQYNDEWTGDVVHQSSPKFQEYLNKAKEFRQTSLKEYLEEASRLDLAKILDNIKVSEGADFHSGMLLYSIKKLYDMTMGEWDYNSYYFDIHHDSANMIHLQNSLDKGADSWYIVPVDFHF